jgi:2-polyprenyl-3-methyl-5-hydroxy-6-metoxy-1,4-benzoquinol methylase
MNNKLQKGSNYFEYDLYNAAKNGNIFEKYFHRARVKQIKRYIDLNGKKVLEFGCGTGAIIIPLLKDGANVDGYDISSSNIERSRNYINQNGLSANIYDHLPDNKYDIILLVNVIEYARGKNDLLKSIISMLKTNGLLLISVANPSNPIIKFDRLRSFFSGRSMSDINTAEVKSPIQSKELIKHIEHNYNLQLKKVYLDLLKINHYLLYENKSND